MRVGECGIDRQRTTVRVARFLEAVRVVQDDAEPFPGERASIVQRDRATIGRFGLAQAPRRVQRGPGHRPFFAQPVTWRMPPEVRRDRRRDHDTAKLKENAPGLDGTRCSRRGRHARARRVHEHDRAKTAKDRDRRHERKAVPQAGDEKHDAGPGGNRPPDQFRAAPAGAEAARALPRRQVREATRIPEAIAGAGQPPRRNESSGCP